MVIWLPPPLPPIGIACIRLWPLLLGIDVAVALPVSSSLQRLGLCAVAPALALQTSGSESVDANLARRAKAILARSGFFAQDYPGAETTFRSEICLEIVFVVFLFQSPSKRQDFFICSGQLFWPHEARVAPFGSRSRVQFSQVVVDQIDSVRGVPGLVRRFRHQYPRSARRPQCLRRRLGSRGLLPRLAQPPFQDDSLLLDPPYVSLQLQRPPQV